MSPSAAVELAVVARIDADFAEYAINDDTATESAAAETIPCAANSIITGAVDASTAKPAAVTGALAAAVAGSAVGAAAAEHQRHRRCNPP